jgi:hypothetical protein
VECASGHSTMGSSKVEHAMVLQHMQYLALQWDLKTRTGLGLLDPSGVNLYGRLPKLLAKPKSPDSLMRYRSGETLLWKFGEEYAGPGR